MTFDLTGSHEPGYLKLCRGLARGGSVGGSRAHTITGRPVRPQPKTSLGLLCSLAVFAALTAVGSAAATVEPAGTAVVQPNVGSPFPPVERLTVSSTGITYETQQPDDYGFARTAFYRSFASQSAGVLAHVMRTPSGGPFATVVAGVSAIVQSDPNDLAYATGVTLQPVGGGASTALPIAEYTESYVGQTGTGIVVARNLQSGDYGVDLLLRRSGQADLLLDHLGNMGFNGGIVDANGMFIQVTSPTMALKYIDFATHTVTQVNTDPNDTYAAIAFMTPTMLGWSGGLDHRTMVWMPRAGGAQARLAVPVAVADASAFALSGATVAFTAPAPNLVWTLYTMPANGSSGATAVALDVVSPHPVAAPSGGFYIAGRHSPTDLGIYTVQSGQATLYQAIAPSRASVWAASSSGGRLAFEDTSAPFGSDLALWSLQTGRSGGAITLGSQTGLTDNTRAPFLLTSDDRTAYQADVGTAETLVVLNGSTPERTPVGYTGAITLSGDKLLLQNTAATNNWSAFNTVTGKLISVTTSSAALWGPYLYYQGTSKGQILRRDLTKAVSVSNPTQIRAGDTCGIGPGGMLAWGRWLAFSCSNGTAKNYDQVINTTSGEIIPFQRGRLQALGDGVLAWIDANSSIETMDLVNPAHPITVIADLGTLDGTAPERWALDSSGAQSVAFVGTDEKLHVAPLAIPASPPALLDWHPDKSVPAGGSWHAAYDASKPVTWTLRIKTTAGVVFRTLTGVAPDGAIKATWDGRRTDASVVPAGTYKWALTATGSDGIGVVKKSGSLTVS
jgi:hypothetical protein